MTTAANAGYMVSVVETGTGLQQAELLPGDSLSLDVLLDGVSDGSGQTHDSVDMVVDFSKAGLILDSYSWTEPPFVTGGLNDFSNPDNSALPMAISSLTLSGNTDQAGDVFGTGVLATLNLTIPGDWMPTPDSVEVSVADGASLNDFTNFLFPNVSVGSPFTLRIVPEPATLALLGIGGIAVLRRRRRA
jgi:hypothetical protein